MARVLSLAVLEGETEQELYLFLSGSVVRVPENQENWNIVTQIPVLVNFFIKNVEFLMIIILHELHQYFILMFLTLFHFQAVENSNVKLVAALIRRGDVMAKMIVIYIRKTMISVTKIFVNVCTIKYRNFPLDIFL